jgi:hypothetical protein
VIFPHTHECAFSHPFPLLKTELNRFHYSIFIHVYEVLHIHLPLFSLSPLPWVILPISPSILHLCHFFIWWDREVGTQGFVLAKQELYRLNSTSSPFCSGCFGMRSCELFAQAGLEPQSS